MALDGISIAALVDQFKTNLLDAHVERIIQPQPEVIQINFKTQDGIRRLKRPPSVCFCANISAKADSSASISLRWSALYSSGSHILLK